jgi:hypothetical protein
MKVGVRDCDEANEVELAPTLNVIRLRLAKTHTSRFVPIERVRACRRRYGRYDGGETASGLRSSFASQEVEVARNARWSHGRVPAKA